MKHPNILIATDGDGVCFETKDTHKLALNKAIEEIAGPEFVITDEEHLKIFDGKKTHEKLALLNSLKGLPVELNEQIWYLKQKLTVDYMENIPRNEELIHVFKTLKEKGIKLACCSNAIRESLNFALAKTGIIEYFDLILSNEDVNSSKPHPELYWKAMSKFGVLPEETLIIEDSPVGLLAAHRSGARVLRVKNPSEVTLENIYNKLQMKEEKKNKWVDPNLTVVIPAAGMGKRFRDAGFSFSKPLITIPNLGGKTMIQAVVENLGVEAKFVFIVQKEDYDKYHLDHFLRVIAPNCEVVAIDGLTEGSAQTVLAARQFLDNDNPVLLANSDQLFFPEGVSEFLYAAQENKCDASILTFKNQNPKFSYCRLDESGNVVEVAEKTVISDNANVGVFYHRKGSDCLKYIDQMISKNIRFNNEFYYSLVLNEAIQDDQRVTIYEVEEMACLGDPEGLAYFIENYRPR